ncbi:MAG TPA: DNA polymerase III subunit delta, partial [Verrucomicrobiae bacterium]|nr:DNA polymerase III subunit delta [Verrucomicrobiae bacterium]
MPSPAKPAPSIILVCGDDEFAVKQRAKVIYQEWAGELGGMDHEIIDASAANSGEALKALGRLREALQTLPFFGSGKAVWLQDCNFLGDERTASAQAVTETLGEIAQELKDFAWGSVRLLISAGKVDKRKVFYKTIDKLGAVESFAGWSIDDRDWAFQAEAWARDALRARKKEVSDEALAELVNNVGPHARQLSNEVEKLALFAGERTEIEAGDVAAICSRNKSARAFALGDALGDRDLPRLLRTLDEELWEMKFDKQRSEIGLLYGLIGKVRAMILLKEMLREGWIKPDVEYSRFKSQLERVPAGQLPEDKR